ncbi:unnamed protein product [Durusdinium trenchii]|uniref:Protein HGH1 homolog n=1 Tax=Durusdinium trenchii TaxID=1381693 RepID=A0ABP0LX36_9DINO
MVSFLSERDIKDLQDYLGLGAGGTARRTTTVNRSRLATVEAEIPLLTSMIQELDSAIAGHTDIHNSSTIVFEKASHLASLPAEKCEAMFDDIKVKTNMKTGKMEPNLLRAAREVVSKTFAEQVCMLAERHPDIRSILIRTLTKCGSIANEIGPPCLHSMALLAQADDDTCQAVLEVDQEAGMGLQYARLEELDDEKVQQLLHMLDPEIVQSDERLLGAVLRNLTQFLEKDGEAADKFRRNHTRSVIDRTFKVLATNCARETFGNPDEEEQKVTLSEQCVQVLITASFQPLLRRHLRREVSKDFLKILKDHETLDTWTCRDVNVELTWTGRHLDLLLSCLNTTSPMCLNKDMKQAFRVFHRIANVMAGVGDCPEMARTAEERAAEETVFWDEKLMRQEANLLDDMAYEDQLQQQMMFFSFNGIEGMAPQTHVLGPGTR